MSKFLTIAYMTNRRDCRIEWFFDSLWLQWKENKIPIRLVAIDFWADRPSRKEEFAFKADAFVKEGVEFIHVTPKPTVWQGQYRITSRDYFAAANARNTAICLAPDGYLAYVDDLSVLLPAWLSRVQKAMDGGYVALGTYEKVRALKVEEGEIIAHESTPHGQDSRIVYSRKQYAHQTVLPELIPCSGSWFFGCSIAAPLQSFLTINGWDENCDSCGAEDYPCGYMIERAGYKLYLDPAMKTLESEELHFIEQPFLRIDKPNIKGQRDGSNAYLKMLLGGIKRAPNYFPEGGIVAERERVLAGEPFTITQIPQHDWRDGQPLTDM